MLYVSSTAKFPQTSHFIMRSSLYGFPRSAWKRSIWHTGIEGIKLELMLTRFPVQYYSTQRKHGTGRLPRTDSQLSMEDERNAFYVVRKGDVVGVFKNLSDCQAQISSVVDPAISAYKGYSLPKEAEKCIISHGLKNPSYAINAAHVKEDLFGRLVHCPLKELVELASISKDQHKKQIRVENFAKLQSCASKSLSCILEIDASSKGSLGKAGAAAILRAEDGPAVWRLRQGVGTATYNVAVYQAMILGLKCALMKGFKNIHVQGDSKLVCMQMQGLWKTKHQNMIDLCKEVKELEKKFLSFSISLVDRKFNSEADAQAKIAVNLEDGEVEEDYDNES